MKKNIPKVLSVLLFVGLIALFAVNPAKAATGQTGLKISPLTFKFSIEQGKSQSSSVAVTNEQDVDISVTTEKEDFLMEGEEGVPRFLPKGSGETTLSPWISISADSFKLAPHETKDVVFDISVPQNGEPGGHYAAIFFKTEPVDQNGQNQIGISARVGALILVAVPGELSGTGSIVEFKAPSFSAKSPVEFLARFKNTGTIHYQTGGKILIYNMWGKKSGEVELPQHIVLPDSIRQYKNSWDAHYMIGKYRTVLEMKDGEGNIQTAETSFTAFPVKEALIGIGIVILIIILIAVLKKSFRIVKK